MVVGEIPEFFLFPKRDISTERCKCTIYIFTYKGIKVVIRTEFINMTVLLSMWAVFFVFVFVFVFVGAEFRCNRSLYSMLLFEILYLIQIFDQNLLNKKDDTCRPMDTNLSAWIELSVWRSKRCHEHSMVKFVSTRVYLIHHICVCITEQVWALEGCTSANFPNYILSRDRDEGFVSNGSKDVSHDNKIYSCTMELRNESASFVVIFVLFCFHLGRICDLCFSQKCWKSFYS